MTDTAKVELILLLTDRMFGLLEHIKLVGVMSHDQVMGEIAKERQEKDSLMEDIGL